ncbi:MAG: cupin domain-containing protein [Actinomycetota bacterium]
MEGNQLVPWIVGRTDGTTLDLGTVGVRYLVRGEESGGGFALVEHPIAPRTLAAPPHRHVNEDEYSFVLEGRLGALLGDEVVYVEPGELAVKPRGQWHTVWNAGDTECRILELISPAGFEHYFEAVAEAGGRSPEVAARYGFEVDFDAIDALCAEHGLRFPPRI